MIFPLFASFIIFTAWLTFHLHHRKEVEESAMDSFWEKERKANSTRRKSLDGLAYITLPIEQLPMDCLAEDPAISDCLSRINFLSQEKIVNLTGITNTDLKLAYGVANLPLLARYDQNYTTLVRTLQDWGQLLYTQGYCTEALSVLEFALSTKTDVTATYQLLQTIYLETGHPEKIEVLKEYALQISSASQKTILHILA